MPILSSSRFTKFNLVILLTACISVFFFYQAAAQQTQSTSFDLGHAILQANVWGQNGGETIIALPGSGSDNSRYASLGPLIAAQGYRFIAVNQRGIMGSTGELEDLTLHDYGNDIAQLIDLLGVERVHLMGWALGNRISRVVATDHPEKVASITLLAAGGLARPLTEPGALGRLLSEENLPLEEKIQLARDTLFSPHTEQSKVAEFASTLNYWPQARDSQVAANRVTPLELWWSGGDGPMLIVQGEDDLTAPPENGERMKAEFADRVTLVNLPDAGHLMAFEKPEQTAAAVLEFLKLHPVK